MNKNNLLLVLLLIFYLNCDILCYKYVSKLNQDPLLQVNTQNGRIQGRRAFTDNGKEYFAYQGIPFAKPPLGNLRFSPPVPPDNWKGVLNATVEGQTCIEIRVRPSGVIVEGHEDCLYLNIFTPKVSKTDKNFYPIMVWFEGGGFMEGNSSFKVLNPNNFLNENVIIVTMNYRIGIYGFLSTGDMASPGNYGLKDQHMVLKWTQINGKIFGGDTKRVTIFGQSAGGASVLYHLQYPKSKGLFHRAIAESGSSICNWAFQVKPADIAEQIGLAFKIETKNSSFLVEELRKIDEETLKSGVTLPSLLSIVTLHDYGLAFAPSREPDHKGAFFTGRSYEDLVQGNFLKVPLIIGHNSQESRFFQSLLRILEPLLIYFDIVPGALASVNFNIKTAEEKRRFGMDVTKHYFAGNSFIGSTKDELYTFLTDDSYARAIIKTVQLISKHVPVYTYLFSFDGDLGKKALILEPNYKGSEHKGVAHSEDLAYLWKRYTDTDVKEEERKFGRKFVRLWTNFAKYGNPTPFPEIMLDNISWPSVTDSSNIKYLNFDKELKVEKNLKINTMIFWDNLIKKYAHGPFDTY